jgi:unsaturated pyranuronate lyase
MKRASSGRADTWSIPSNVPHEVQVGREGAIMIENFTPARSDWSALERLAPTSPRWPT